MAHGVLFFTGEQGVIDGIDRDIFMHHCADTNTDAYI